jgi:hypothetical protein
MKALIYFILRALVLAFFVSGFLQCVCVLILAKIGDRFANFNEIPDRQQFLNI